MLRQRTRHPVRIRALLPDLQIVVFAVARRVETEFFGHLKVGGPRPDATGNDRSAEGSSPVRHFIRVRVQRVLSATGTTW